MTEAPILTEQEILAAARAIRELQTLRGLQAHPSALGGKITLQGGGSTIILPMEVDEFAAVIALLIERHTVVVASLGVTPEVVPA